MSNPGKSNRTTWADQQALYDASPLTHLHPAAEDWRRGERPPYGGTEAVGLNPKDAIASAKPDLSLVTRAMAEAIAAGIGNGVVKYGRNNWRSTPVRALVYTAAAVRHIKAWEDGEDRAADSGVHHLDHAIASLCIMRDAAAFGTLVDNRELGTRPAAAGPDWAEEYRITEEARAAFEKAYNDYRAAGAPSLPAPPGKRYGIYYASQGRIVPSGDHEDVSYASLTEAQTAAKEAHGGKYFDVEYFAKELDQ